MSRYELTDYAWRAIVPLLPDKPQGVPRVDDRAHDVERSDRNVRVLEARKDRETIDFADVW